MPLGKNVTTKEFHVYSKISRSNRPFWGLTKNRLDQLDQAFRQQGIDYMIELISTATGTKFLLTSRQTKAMLRKKFPANDGDYKLTMKDMKALF